MPFDEEKIYHLYILEAMTAGLGGERGESRRWRGPGRRGWTRATRTPPASPRGGELKEGDSDKSQILAARTNGTGLFFFVLHFFTRTVVLYNIELLLGEINNSIMATDKV